MFPNRIIVSLCVPACQLLSFEKRFPDIIITMFEYIGYDTDGQTFLLEKLN